MKQHIRLILTLFIITALGLAVYGCVPKIPGTSRSDDLSMKGFSLSPKSFDAKEFDDFFVKTAEAGDVVMWAGDWNTLFDTQSAPYVIVQLCEVKPCVPVIELQFFTQSSGALIRPLDEGNVQAYADSAMAFAAMFKPDYLGIGIEVNMLYEKSPEDFEKFIELYKNVYFVVKEVSPKTKVFTVFQLERMKGLHGGLFGGENDDSLAQWDLISKFDSDIIAFTTYPGLIYKSPSEIPADYYTDIRSHIDASKPIAFTEIGWHSAASPKGWESSEEEQAEFVSTFFNLTHSIKPELMVWSFLYDQTTIESFDTMGMFTSAGKEKLAWDVWKEE